jgi:hypothetical protein
MRANDMTSKYEELIITIAFNSATDPAFDLNKLNRALFTIDFLAYGAFGHAITDSIYVHRQHGPAARDIHEKRHALVQSGRAAIQTHHYLGSERQRLVALGEPDVSVFSAPERILIEQVIEELKSLNDVDLDDWTHRLLPWLATEDGEEIPYHSVFVSQRRQVGQEGFKWAQQQLTNLKAGSHAD